MRVRPYQPTDAAALQRIFEQQGFEYECPNFNDSSLLSKTVVEHNGTTRMAILARLTAEAYFLVDSTFGSPQERWQAFLELHEAARLDCYQRGFDDIYAWVPPQVVKPFGRRLMRLGWERNKWTSFNRPLVIPTSDAKEARTCESIV